MGLHARDLHTMPIYKAQIGGLLAYLLKGVRFLGASAVLLLMLTATIERGQEGSDVLKQGRIQLRLTSYKKQY
jgi:hypothetical protein